MEVKINKEIRDFTESIFFGLSMRQFIFSLLACIDAVILYWLCILGAIPFAVLGFVKYNNMTIEKIIVAWIKSEVLMPRKLTFKAENIYAETLKPVYEKIKKEEMKIENRKKIKKEE